MGVPVPPRGGVPGLLVILVLGILFWPLDHTWGWVSRHIPGRSRDRSQLPHGTGESSTEGNRA